MDRQQTSIRIFFEFGNPNRILAKEFFDYVEGEITALKANEFRRRSFPLVQSYKIGVRRDHRIALVPCPIPDFLVSGLFEADIAYVDQAGI